MALSRGPNPLMDDAGTGDIPLRTAPWMPGNTGLGDFSGALSSMQAYGEAAYNASMPEWPAPVSRPVKAFSPSSGKLFVNGFTFDVDDAQKALESEQYLGATPQATPAGDWIPLDDASYSAYLNNIRNPSMGRLAAKNFGRGVDISQLLAGRGLQFAGAEKFGASVVDSQMEDLRKTSPYERMFTDIGSEPNRGVLDWFVANLAQQGPNLVESAVAALGGALVGGAAGGGANPFSAAGGALAALSGKAAIKQSVLAAAKKYSRGEAIDAVETKLLHEQAGILAAAKIKEGTLYAGPQGLMNAGQFTSYLVPQSLKAGAQTAGKAGLTQARIGGAAIATGLQNYATGIADIYGESIESGNPDRAYAAMAGIPYAAFETLPEFLLAGRVFGNIGAKPRIRDITGIGAKAGAVASRAGAGFVYGGLTEGTTEASQEGLLFGANAEVDWDSPEGINRLVNSFAAGFGVGGPIGAGANIAGKLQANKPANLLNPAATTEPPAAKTIISPPKPEPTPPTPAAPASLGYSPRQIEQGQQGVLDIFGYTPEGEYQQRAAPTQYGVEEQPQAGLQLPNDQQQEMQFGAPDLAQGQQGVLDIFGPASQAELDQRMQPTQYGAAAEPDLRTQANEWDKQNRYNRSDIWFEGGKVDDAARAGFDAALQNGGDQLPAHGMSKESTLSGAVQNLLGLLQNGLDPNRRGGRLDYAPLVTARGSAASQVSTTAGGSAYSDGPFILVGRPGQEFEGKLDGVGAILVNQASAEIVPALRKAVQAIRPDILVEAYSNAGEVSKQLTQNAAFDTSQGALQFAAPAPEGMQFTNQPAPPQTAIGQQMYALQQQQQLQQEFEAAQQQRQLELDAQRQQDFNRMEAQRQLQLSQQPEVVEVPPAPKGQPLRRGKGRKPPTPKGEKLRVGKGGQMEAFGKQQIVPVAPEAEPTVDAGPAPKQLKLFTKTGKPTKEATKGNKLKKGKKNADQERVATTVPPTQPTGTGEAGGAAAGTTARKALPLRKGKARAQTFNVQDKETVQVNPYEQADDALYDLATNLASKGEVKKFAEKLVKQGLLTKDDISFIPTMMKDRDMAGEDIVSELRSVINIAKDRAAEAEAELKRPKGEAAAKAAADKAAADKAAAVVVNDKLALSKWFAKAPDSPTTPNYNVLPEDIKAKWKAAIAAGETTDEGGRKVAKQLIKEYQEYVDNQAPQAWEDMMDDGTDSFVKFYDMSDDLRAKWIAAVYFNKATVELGDKLTSTARNQTEENGQSDMSMLEDAIEDAANAKTSTTFRLHINTILYHAFFETDSNNFRDGVVDRALQFLRDTELSQKFANIAKEIFVGLTSEYESLEVRYKSGKQKNELKPWYAFAIHNDILRVITAINPDIELTNIGEEEATARLADESISLSNLAKSVAKVFEKQEKERIAAKAAEAKKEAELRAATTASSQPQATPQAQLGQIFDDMFSDDRFTPFGSDRKKKDLAARLTKLYDQVAEDDRGYIIRGYPLRDYFRKDGTPKLRWGSFKETARYAIGVDDITDQQARDNFKELMVLINAERKAAKQEEMMERLNAIVLAGGAIPKNKNDSGITAPAKDMEGDRDEGAFRRADGTPIKGTMAPGKVRMIAASILAKFKMTPKVFYYANLRDLQTRNPELYKKAKAAYKGDFDSVVAMGYSFNAAKDPTVILFTDHLHTEEAVRFVIAHEVLGHYGFRSIMPIAELNKILMQIYESDPDVQAIVDAEMELKGISKLEAIEEYLADNAADVDASVLRKIWNALKNALNKIGFTFKDDAARYLVSRARKYVRDGGGSTVSTMQMADDISTMANDGRFATVHSIGDAGSRLFGSSGMLNLNSPSQGGGISGVAKFFADKMFGTRANTPGNVSRLLNHIQTLDNKARRSYGLSLIYRMLEQQQGFARKLLTKYQRMTDYSLSIKVTEKDKLEASSLMADAALYRGKQMSDEIIRNSNKIVNITSDGTPYINQAALNEIINAGFVTADEFRKGFTIEYDTGAQTIKPRDIDENSNAWKVYLEYRNAVNEAAIDVMLSNFMAAQDESNRILNDLNDGRKIADTLTDEDIEAIRMVGEMYKTMRYENAKIANAAVNIDRKSERASEDLRVAFGLALFSDDAFKVWMKDPAADVKAANKASNGNVNDFSIYQSPEYDAIRSQLPSLRDKIRNKDDSYRVQKSIQDLFLFDLQAQNAEYYAKRTIMGSYVPFTRRGSEQVRLAAKDASGNYVELHTAAREILPYYQYEDRADALRAQEELEKVFGDGQEWDMPVDDGTGGEVTKKVFLVPEVSRTRQSPDLTEVVNFNEFIYVLNRLNINLTPKVRETVVKTLTDQNSKARKNLQRSGTPGWNEDVVRSASEYLETSAHVAAKKRYRHRLDDIFLRQDNWKGSDLMLQTLKRAVDDATTPGEKAQAQRVYAQYAYMYRYMKATGKNNKVEIDGKVVPTLGRGEDYKEEAKGIIRWYSETSNVSDTTEDVLSGETGSRLKTGTVLMQLGGSVATAIINFTSLLTHSLPYLSFYNAQQGYGGGYGSSKAGAALYDAARTVANPKMADDKFLADMVSKGTHADYGLTRDEAMFLLNATEQGVLQAAQFNALIGSARGKVGGNVTQKVIQTWMSMFTYTEQMNRRTTALAAYRLEKNRALANGKSDIEAGFMAEEAARKAVNYSQGEYAMFNRPEMARGNFMQYVFMYKQFTIITVQMLRAMPLEGRMLMLGFLMLASGIRGLPFAEDIMDLVDTLCQKLGLKVGSVEKAAIDAIESVAPGVSPYIMNGVINRALGATVSTRLGMGDLIPFTGAFRAGASPIRELENFAGPVIGAMSGLAGTAYNLGTYGAEVIGLKDDTTSLVSIMRDSPLAAMRSIGDAYAYTTDGLVTNRKGQVVSQNVTPSLIVARLLGFYPNIATEQNDIVRLSKQIGEYAKEVKAGYVQAYVKASISGDGERMREIEGYVRNWNEDAKGTGLEITNFVPSAQRAAREAKKPTAARYLKSAPKNVKPETIELLNAAGYEVAEL